MAEIGDDHQLSPLLPIVPQKKVGPRNQPKTVKERAKRGRQDRSQSEQITEESETGSRKNRIDDYA